MARFLAGQDAPTLAQALLELAEGHEPVYQRLVRLRLRDDPNALRAQFTLQRQRWEADDRLFRHHDAAAIGRELDVWIAHVQREVLPRFPSEAMALFNYGFTKLSELVRKQAYLEVKETTDPSGFNHLSVRAWPVAT